MKNIWLKKYFGIGCVAILLLGACSDGGGDKPDEPDPKAPEIIIPSGVDLNPVFKAEGNDPVSLEFTTTAAWSVSITNTRADSWIIVNPLSGGAGKNNITITAQANSTNDERSAKITLRSGNVTKDIVVTQKKRAADPDTTGDTEDFNQDNQDW